MFATCTVCCYVWSCYNVRLSQFIYLKDCRKLIQTVFLSANYNNNNTVIIEAVSRDIYVLYCNSVKKTIEHL